MKYALMADSLAGADSLGASQHELDLILNGDYEDAFGAQDYFSTDGSTGHIFDVIDGQGIMRSNLSGDGLVKMIKVSKRQSLSTLSPWTCAVFHGPRGVYWRILLANAAYRTMNISKAGAMIQESCKSN